MRKSTNISIRLLNSQLSGIGLQNVTEVCARYTQNLIYFTKLEESFPGSYNNHWQVTISCSELGFPCRSTDENPQFLNMQRTSLFRWINSAFGGWYLILSQFKLIIRCLFDIPFQKFHGLLTIHDSTDSKRNDKLAVVFNREGGVDFLITLTLSYVPYESLSKAKYG